MSTRASDISLPRDIELRLIDQGYSNDDIRNGNLEKADLSRANLSRTSLVGINL